MPKQTEQTLLEQARTVATKRRLSYTSQEDDLAIAYLHGQVNDKQVGEVMHFTPENTSYFIKCCLRDAATKGRIVITKVMRGAK